MNKDFQRNRKEYIRSLQPRELDPISTHFQKHVGEIIESNEIALSNKNNIYIHQCQVKNEPYKLLFTVGLCTIRNYELYLCLSHEWNIRSFLSSPVIEETFPVDLLREIVQKTERKNSEFSLHDGFFIDKTKSPWNKLCWGKIDGFVVMDHEWKDKKENEETGQDKNIIIKLFALLPVLNPQKKISAKEVINIANEYRSCIWKKVCLPLNPLIETQNNLNEAIINKDFKNVKGAIDRGADVNRGYIDHHFQFGYYTQHTLLERAFDTENEDIIKYLIENGAEVPVNALAHIGRWGTMSIFDYLVKKGADINAESVNMTAMERAKAFKNKQGIQDLLVLGARK